MGSRRNVISLSVMPTGEMSPTSHDREKISDLEEMLSSMGQSSQNSNNSNFIRFLLHDVFFVILVVLCGVEPTMLIFELDSLASSLIEHHVAWHYDTVYEDDDGEVWRFHKDLLSCVFIFSDSHIFIQGGETLGDLADSFKISYKKHAGQNRKGNPSNGAFPAVELSFGLSDLEDLELFRDPQICRYENELFYNFGHLKIFKCGQYFFFVFSSVEFYIDDKNEEKEFNFNHLEFSFPILSGSEPSPDSIDFQYLDYSNGFFEFVASFDIQIGSGSIRCEVLFGLFLKSSYEHSDGRYTLDIIRVIDGTTNFFSYVDSKYWEDEGGKQVGILRINIPTFRAPKTNCPLELASALKVLPDDIQSFLQQITWKNPESTAVQAAEEDGSN